MSTTFTSEEIDLNAIQKCIVSIVRATVNDFSFTFKITRESDAATISKRIQEIKQFIQLYRDAMDDNKMKVCPLAMIRLNQFVDDLNYGEMFQLDNTAHEFMSRFTIEIFKLNNKFYSHIKFSIVENSFYNGDKIQIPIVEQKFTTSLIALYVEADAPTGVEDEPEEGRILH